MVTWIKTLWNRHEGSTLVVVAFAAMAVVGAVGVAVDVGRSQMVAAKLQSTVDAAGLAAGASINSDDLEAIAEKYVQVNFASGTIGATLGEINTSLSDDRKVLTVSASATLPTTITNVFGKSSVEVDATTEITRSNKGLELALVLDTTGSMGKPASKMATLKSASHDLLDILFGDEAVAENLWVGIVPFAHTVNIGPSRANWLNASHYSSLMWNTPSNWAGCVEARWSSGRDVTDDPTFDLADPSAATPAAPYERLKAYYSPISNWNTSGSTTSTTRFCTGSSCTCAAKGPCGPITQTAWNKGTTINCGGSGSSRWCDRITRTYVHDADSGPNMYCPPPITALTNVKATLASGIDALVSQGHTHINLGAVWGWRLISPRWRGFWGGVMDANALPLNYGSPLMSKAVIIMTDGTNTTTSYSAYPPASGVNASQMDTKLTTVCNAMKAEGVLVYTVLFQEDDATIKTLMRNCATTPDYFFDSPSEEDLEAAFHTIGDSLANLRISR